MHAFFSPGQVSCPINSQATPRLAPGPSNRFPSLPIQVTPSPCFTGITFSTRRATSSISTTPSPASPLPILTLVSGLWAVPVRCQGAWTTQTPESPRENLVGRGVRMPCSPRGSSGQEHRETFLLCCYGHSDQKKSTGNMVPLAAPATESLQVPWHSSDQGHPHTPCAGMLSSQCALLLHLHPFR